MKKILLFTFITLCICFLSSCLNTQVETASLPIESPLDMTFSSGAGGWGTMITLNPDGSFTGNFHDSEMGSIGDDYPAGSIYYSNFNGKFSNIEKINDYSYSMTLESITTDYEIGKEEIIEGIKYISAEPYGFETGKDFILYSPSTLVGELSEEFLSWWPGRYSVEDLTGKTLNSYGLYNKETEYGFFSEYNQD